MKLAVTRGIASETAPQQESSEEPAAGKAVLIIAGSANPYTKKQMELLLRAEPESVRISVSPNRLLEDGEAHSLEVEQTAAKLRDILSAPDVPKVLLVETALHDSLVNLKEEDEKHGYAPGESSARINRGLAEIADQVLRGFGKERIAGLLLTGGDTMESVQNDWDHLYPRHRQHCPADRCGQTGRGVRRHASGRKGRLLRL